MFIIQQITRDPLQKQTLILPDGTSLSMTIYFMPMQYGWFITSLIYKSFTLNGLRITVSPNMLRQFKNQIPFGLACYANSEKREPTQQQDFSSGAFSLFLLDRSEVTAFEEILSGNVNG
jgi:hypothetical protein